MTDAVCDYESLKVLVVDDSKVQRDYLIDLCEFYGVGVVAGAEDGKDALEKLNQSAFDLAFIDLEMPVMDGVTLVREIAANKLVQHIIILSSKDPVLILSVGTMAENDGLTVIGTVKKPIQGSVLTAGFDQLLLSKTKKRRDHPEFNVTAEDLANAIKNKEIFVVYQPKLKADNLALVGVEALARWKHAEYGFIAPDKFISIAERFGLIESLTELIFKIAFKQKHYWNDKGANFNLALNLSPISLNDSQLVDNISQLSEKYQIKPEEITLEVTENAISMQVSQSIEVLAKLRLKGFHISVDDYGTGYASIQQLSRVPATELKIDKSLVINIASRKQQQAILKSTLGMAKDLQLKTVIEGVENKQDFAYLRSFDVGIVQGYLFAKPMSAEDFELWLKKSLAKLREQFLN